MSDDFVDEDDLDDLECKCDTSKEHCDPYCCGYICGDQGELCCFCLKIKVHPKNIVNDLTAGKWLQKSKSWFIADAGNEAEWKGMKDAHPGTFPKKVPLHLIPIYSKRGGMILDPFMGTGTTLIVAAQLGRKSIGIDLSEDYNQLTRDIIDKHFFPHDQKGLDEFVEMTGAAKARAKRELWRPQLITGDALKVYDQIEPDSVDYILTSPPYSNALHYNSGGVMTRHKKRQKAGLDTVYSDDDRDLGNMSDEAWLHSMVELADRLLSRVKPKGHMTMIVQNFVGVHYRPLAWWLAEAITTKTDWTFCHEMIWCQDSKSLQISGHPARFLTSNVHHYCLTWRKEVDSGSEKESD